MLPDKIKISCLECGATNNYPRNPGGKAVVCGRCKTPLPEPGRVLEPPANQVVNLIQTGALPLLIDFYSTTCMPCHMMAPIIESLAGRRAGDLVVLKVNTDQQPDLAAAFKIKAVPTFLVMKKGFEIGRVSGAMPETDFSLWVASKA
jgi:thioredoxin 2